jgi:hypothetical protein
MNKAFGVLRALDDLGHERWQNVGQRLLELTPLVSGVSEQLCQERMSAEQSRQQQHAAIAVLNVGGMNDCVQQQA